jgi:hypothetical protein
MVLERHCNAGNAKKTLYMYAEYQGKSDYAKEQLLPGMEIPLQ